MPEADTAFAALMEQVLEGDNAAAKRLHQEYGPHILRAVRKRLHQKLRSKFDSLDFVQDVWASFFRSVPDNFQFATPEDLVAFLTTVARNKVADATRTRLMRQKFNVGREIIHVEDTGHSMDQYPDDLETPSEILMGQEAWDQFLAKQPLVYRRILILFRQGRPLEKIALDLNLTQKTIQRALTRALNGAKK